MSSLAKSCLRMLAVYIVLAVAIGLFVYHRLPMAGPAIWSGIIAGFFLWLTLAYVYAIPTQLRDWWRMRSGAPFRDGKRVAVIGTVHPASSSLYTPFTKTSCVAYQYKITSLKGESPHDDYEGFAMTPSYVHTPQGQIKILAYPELDMKDEPVRGQEMKANAREFIDKTTFFSVREAGIKAAAKELRELQADDDGSMRYDHRMDPVSELDDCRLTERILRTGDTICALGRYSEERKALVPDPSAAVHAATIRKGTPESFRRGALRKAFGSAIGVVICGGLVTGAAVIFLLNIPMDASEQMNPNRRFLWEEVKLERWLEKNVRMPLVQSGSLNAPGMHLLELCNGCATGRMEIDGKTTELRHASGWENETTRVIHLAPAEGKAEGVTITLDRKAQTWKIVLNRGRLEISIPDGWTLPTDFQTAFGSDNIADGRVTVVAPDDTIRVRAAFRVPVETREEGVSDGS